MATSMLIKMIDMIASAVLKKDSEASLLTVDDL